MLIHLFYILLLPILCIGCFRAKEVPVYTIYRSSVWEGVNLHGMEKNVQGFTDDLFFEIAKDQDFKINFVASQTSRTISLLEQNDVDAVLTTQTPSLKNEKDYEFSDPFFAFGPMLLLRANDSLAHFRSLKMKMIGFSRSLGEDLMTREDLGYIFRPYEQVTAAIEDLLSSKIDAVVVDSIYSYQLARGLYAGKIQVATPLFKGVTFRLAVKRGKNVELIARFNKELAKFRENGTYTKILEYWGLYEPTMGIVYDNSSTH